MVGPEVAVLDRPAEAPKPAVPEPAPSPNGSSSEAGTAAQEPQEPQEDQSAPIATDTDAAPTTPDATANREDELPSEGSAQGASETEVPAQPGNRERVEMVATVILASQVVGARAAMKGKPPEAFADPANQGKLALLGYGAIAQLQGENNLDLFGGETITVTVKDEVTGEDKQYIVKQVNQGDGDTLQCEVEGQTDLQPLSRQAVLNAYFLAEAPAIANELPAGHPQRVALELHAQALRGEDIAVNSEQTARVLQEAKANLNGAEWESPIARMLKERIGAVQIEIKARAGRGEDVTGYQRVLRMLNTAQASKGDLGIIFQGGALQAAGIETAVLEAAIPQYSEQVAQARETLIAQMNLSQEKIDALNQAGNNVELAAKIIEAALLEKNKGKEIEQLVFGRELQDGELEKLLGLDKKSKDSKMGLLLLIAYLIKGMVEPLVNTKQGG